MPKTLLQQAFSLPLAVRAVAGLVLALFCCAVPVSAQESCQQQYAGCMANVTTAYNSCVANVQEYSNPQLVCADWEGTEYYENCVETMQWAQQQEIQNCQSIMQTGQGACEAELTSCLSGYGTLVRPSDRLFRYGLPPAKLNVDFARASHKPRIAPC